MAVSKRRSGSTKRSARRAVTVYGLATWGCLRARRSDPGFLSLETAVRLARKVGGEEHGFRFVQFPFNLAIPEGVTAERTRGRGAHGPLRCGPQARGRLYERPALAGPAHALRPETEWAQHRPDRAPVRRSAPAPSALWWGRSAPSTSPRTSRSTARSPWDAETFRSLLA